MSRKTGTVPARFLIATAFVLFAASAGHAGPPPAIEEVYRVPSEAVARPPDNIDIYQPPNDCVKYSADTPEYKCCKAGIYEKDPEWLCCAKNEAKGCDDGNPCTDDTCASIVAVDKLELDIKKPIPGVPQCLHNPNDNCQDCGEKYKGQPAAAKCCSMGFDTDPTKMKCCVDHLSNGEDPGTPAKPKPCNDCPQCPECRQPEFNCDKIVGNEDLKKCCTTKDKKLWFVLDACIPDGPGSEGDCNIVINAGGDFINNGQLNICCQVVNNSGTITDTTISQACNNTTGGGPSPTGGTPTTPAGSASALGTCSVAPASSDTIGGKEFAFGKDWIVTYTAPSGVGSVASVHLTKVEGVEITADDPADSATGGWIKTIADPSSLPPFSVHTARPPEMATKEKAQAQFKVRVQLKDLAGGELASMECDNAGFYEGQGGAGCGCNMTAMLTTREQIAAYSMMAFLLMVPLAALRTVRKTFKK